MKNKLLEIMFVFGIYMMMYVFIYKLWSFEVSILFALAVISTSVGYIEMYTKKKE